MTRPTIETFLGYASGVQGIMSMLAIGAIALFALTGRRMRLANPVIGDVTRMGAPRGLIGLILLIVGAAVRVPLLTQSLWYDETFTARLVNIPTWSGFLTALQSDVHPPGYYAVARTLSYLIGSSDVALRLPSFAVGLLLIYLVYRLARLYTRDERAALLAAAITAIAPALTYYSAEARYPVMLAASVLVALIALDEGRPRVFAIAAGATAWLHAVGMVYVELLVIPALLKNRRAWTAAAIAAAAIAAAAIAAAWLPGWIAQSRIVGDGFHLLQNLPIEHLVTMTVRMGTPFPPLVIVQWFAPLALTIFGVWASRRWIERRPRWLLIAVGAPALLWAVGLVWQPVYLSRTLIAPALLMVIAWSWYLVRARGALRMLLGAALAIGIFGGTLITQTRDRTEVATIFPLCNGANTIYTTSYNVAIMATHYARPGQLVAAWSGGDNLALDLSAPARLAMQVENREVDTLPGEVCMVSQLSAYTTDAEMAHITSIRDRYEPFAQQIGQADEMFVYLVMRFRAND